MDINTVHFKDMKSNSDIVKILEEVGFEEIEDNNEEYGYLLEPGPTLSQQIRVYIKSEYLYIDLTLSSLNLEVFKQEGPIFYRHGMVVKPRYWYKVKNIIYKKEAGMKEFRNFLLLSICRDSFLDPEERNNYKFGNNRLVDDDYKDWYI